MKYIRVDVDPNLKKKYTCPDTFGIRYEHMDWCKKNCRYEWYNDTEDYSSIVFSNSKEAFQFALVWSNLTEELKVFAILRWV
jgi:hypothetical protein